MRLHRLSALLLIVVMLLGAPAAVHAHANLERSVPLQDAVLEQAPPEIRIQFTEAFNPKLSQIVLEDADGKQIKGRLTAEKDRWLVYAVPQLQEGIYKVKWQILSVDTHVTEGSFRFSVGVPLEKEAPSETISLDEAPAAASSQGPKQPEPSPAPVSERPSPTPAPASTQASATVSDRDDTAGRAGTAIAERGDPSAAPNGTPQPAQEGKSAPAATAPAASSSPAENEPEVLPASEQPIHDHVHAQPAPAAEIHDHASHGSGQHADGWRAGAYQLLRIGEVLAAACIAGFLFFRHAIWGERRNGEPFLFSLRNERILLSAAALLFAVAGAAHVWLLAEQLTGSGAFAVWDRMGTIIASTMVGTVAWLRPVLAGLLLAFTFVLKRWWATALQAVATLALLALFPLTGHAYGAASGVWIAVCSHLLHMAAASAWFGGLAGIFAATWGWRNLDQAAELNRLIRRFSVIALPMMLVVAISGVGLTMLRLASVDALVQSGYGQLILAKALILLLVVAIAAIHRFVLMPRFAAAIRDETDSAARALKRFALGVRLEIVLAVAAFILAGMLSTTAPPV